MANRSECSTSFWMATQDMPSFPTLETAHNNDHVDVAIVGAGIAGLTCAYLLLREGKRVAVLDDGEVGGGVSGRSTGHLTCTLDDRYFEIARLHGEHGARLAAESHSAAIDRIEGIIRDEGIDCDFTRVEGYLFLSPGESEALLAREQEAALRAGVRDVERIDRAPFFNIGFDTGPCLHFPQQAQFHVLKYLHELARIVVREGGHIFGHTHVTSVEDGTPARLATADGIALSADSVIVATHTPINDRVAMHTKQAAYRSYAIGVTIPKGAIAPVLAWDTADPYHYIRVAALDDTEADLLIVGGEDHRTGQADDSRARYARLEEWTRHRFAFAGSVDYRWSGQIMEPVDAMAFIGRNPGDKNVYIVSGDSGNGLTHATIAGILLTDLIAGRENPWTTLYDPSRVTLRAGKEFVQENLNTAAHYSDWVKGGEVKLVGEIMRGQGAVVRRGLHLIAAYRDERDNLHEYSAVCPHLGCIVHWNSSEKSWDCPCHGSRFDCQGQVVNGPAVANLEQLKHPERRAKSRGN